MQLVKCGVWLSFILKGVFAINSQFGGLFGEASGQRGESFVAAADHGVQTGTLSWTSQHRRAAVLIIT